MRRCEVLDDLTLAQDPGDSFRALAEGTTNAIDQELQHEAANNEVVCLGWMILNGGIVLRMHGTDRMPRGRTQGSSCAKAARTPAAYASARRHHW
jgi:hypothetical protein